MELEEFLFKCLNYPNLKENSIRFIDGSFALFYDKNEVIYTYDNYDEEESAAQLKKRLTKILTKCGLEFTASPSESDKIELRCYPCELDGLFSATFEFFIKNKKHKSDKLANSFNFFVAKQNFLFESKLVHSYDTDHPEVFYISSSYDHIANIFFYFFKTYLGYKINHACFFGDDSLKEIVINVTGGVS